jgi:hypothetical protein
LLIDCALEIPGIVRINTRYVQNAQKKTNICLKKHLNVNELCVRTRFGAQRTKKGKVPRALSKKEE